jgi:alpha-L-fucosidase
LLETGSENGTHWIPAECDVSIRPGWFYHDHEDSKVRTPENLFELYLSSVGRGSVLLLNVPPDKRGLLHENDVQSLKGFRAMLDKEFNTNLAAGAKADASNFRAKSKTYSPANLTDGNKDTYWATDDNVTAANVVVNLGGKKSVKYVVLQEYVKLGQRVKKFTVEVNKDNNWVKVAEATTIGYKRILKIDPVLTDKIRVTISDSKACPVLSNVSVY